MSGRACQRCSDTILPHLRGIQRRRSSNDGRRAGRPATTVGRVMESGQVARPRLGPPQPGDAVTSESSISKERRRAASLGRPGPRCPATGSTKRSVFPERERPYRSARRRQDVAWPATKWTQHASRAARRRSRRPAGSGRRGPRASRRWFNAGVPDDQIRSRPPAWLAADRSERASVLRLASTGGSP